MSATNIERSFAEKTTIHGFLDFVDASNKWVKCFWIFVIILAVAATVVEIYYSIVNYIRSPLMTTYSVVEMNEMRMPQLYVCPNMAVDDKKVAYRNAYDFVNEFFNGPTINDNSNSNGDTSMLGYKRGNAEYFSPNELFTPPPHCIQWSDNGTCLEEITFPPPPPKPSPLPLMDAPVNVWKFFDSITLNVDDVFLECSLRNRWKNCTDIVKPIFDLDYGRCFLVDVNLNQILPGKSVQLIINTIYNSKITSLTTGIVVAVIDRYNPLKAAFDKFYVNSGTFSKVLLQATNYLQVNVDVGETKHACLDKADATVTEYAHVNSTADKWSCKLECSLEISRNMCKCILPFDKSVVKNQHWSSVCTYGEYLECLKKISTSNTYEQEIKTCGSKCLPLCDWWSYSYSISTTELANSNYFRIALDKINATGKAADAFRDRADEQIVLDLAFAELQYTEISQSLSMTGDTMLSNIGGQIGLWLGASLMSVIQLLAFAVACLMNKLKRNRTANVLHVQACSGNRSDTKLSVHSIV